MVLFMKHSRLLTVVIPAYNTGESIHETVTDIATTLSESLDWSGVAILVVDDGSTDNQQTRASAIRAGATVLSFSKNLGKGAAVRAGYREATGELVAFLDADNSYNPEDLKLLIEKSQNCEIVIGKRQRRVRGHSSSMMRNLGSRAFHLLTHIALKRTFLDTQAGIKIIHIKEAREYAETGVVDRFAFDVELLAMAEVRGWRVGEVDVTPIPKDFSTVKVSLTMAMTFLSVIGIAYRKYRGFYDSPKR